MCALASKLLRRFALMTCYVAFMRLRLWVGLIFRNQLSFCPSPWWGSRTAVSRTAVSTHVSTHACLLQSAYVSRVYVHT
jgi:hypothetical protein